MFKNLGYRDKLRQKSLANGNKPPVAWGNKTNLGRKQSLEERRMRSEIQKRIGNHPPRMYGKDHPNWKGGTTKLRANMLGMFEYRQWRSDIFTRDNFTCMDCGKRGGDLEPHHIKEVADIFREYQIKTILEARNCVELWSINNGITLCKECHRKTFRYHYYSFFSGIFFLKVKSSEFGSQFALDLGEKSYRGGNNTKEYELKLCC